MAWNPDISRQLHRAYRGDDAVEFRRLLIQHPGYLRDEDGTDYWMQKAATQGKLSILIALVELGLDVNESPDRENPNDPDNPFYQPEGPIVWAASQAHTSMVRWLLDHGAKINYVVQGRPRCLPLEFAAKNGHLEIVKLLVEHGADIHATWHGINAITQAEDFGQWPVYDYLYSLGARTLRQTMPPDYPGGLKRFLKQMTEQRGPLSDWRLEVPGNPLVTIHLIPVNEKCDVQTLFTVGLSDHRLPQGRREFSCTELRCMLPAHWPLTGAALRDANLNWPVEWMKRLVRQLREADRWPEQPVMFMNGDPPDSAAPLAPNTELCGWLCLKSLGESVHGPDYRWIDIHSLFPIYADERSLVQAAGHEELVRRFQERQVPLYVDPSRPNVAKESHR